VRVFDIKWLLGGILTFCALFFGFTIEVQRSTDLRQDDSLAILAKEQLVARRSQQATAEALARVAEIVQQIDIRGTRALDEHETEVRQGLVPR